jgi:hypothetical protein
MRPVRACTVHVQVEEFDEVTLELLGESSRREHPKP